MIRRFGSDCNDCVHDGCCDDLPFCGGRGFQSKWLECSWCDEKFDQTEGYFEHDGDVYCPECWDEIGEILESEGDVE